MKETMIGNILGQGAVLKTCVEQRDKYLPNLMEALNPETIRKIYITGSGSSYHAAVVIKYYLQKYAKADVQFIMPNLFTYHEESNLSECVKDEEILVIGISQSGNSTSTLAALKKAKDSNQKVLGITENLESRMVRAGYPYMHLLCGKEEVPPETKGYTVTLMMAYLLSLYWGKRIGRLNESEFIEKIRETEEFVNKFDVYIQESLDWFEQNREELLLATKIGITGYGMNYGTVLEAQLKIYECCHLPAVGYEAEEFIHGHVFAYNRNNYLFMIASEGEELKRAARLGKFYRDKITEHVFMITATSDETTDKDLHFSNQSNDELMSMAYVIPFQILAEKLAKKVGINTEYFEMIHIGWPARD